jgi:peptide-methionine (S)-S-oxide reductase
MTSRSLAASLAVGLAMGLALAGGATAQERAGSASDPAAKQEKDSAGGSKAGTSKEKPRIAKATFGGGCFWCTEAVFERVPGVKSVVSGYAGGSVPNPSYEMVCTGQTGHAEVIQVEYDPSVVSYEKLLKVFWASHDPTSLNAQGPDFGTQYRSIILYHDEEQKQAAIKSYKELTAAHVYRRKIVTELAPLTVFFPAEPYHQDYFRNHPESDYCQMMIPPKLHKLQKMDLKAEAEAAKKQRQ